MRQRITALKVRSHFEAFGSISDKIPLPSMVASVNVAPPFKSIRLIPKAIERSVNISVKLLLKI